MGSLFWILRVPQVQRHLDLCGTGSCAEAACPLLSESDLVVQFSKNLKFFLSDFTAISIITQLPVIFSSTHSFSTEQKSIELPKDVFAHHIAPLLSAEDLCGVSTVSKLWHQLANLDEIWQRMMKNDFVSSYKRQDPQADTTPVVSWKAAYGECRNSFYRFSFSHVVPPKHHAIFEIAPWRIRTGDHQFPGLDVFASVGGGANIRLWSIDKSGNPQLEAQVRCNTPASFRKLVIVPSPDSTKAVAVMYESTETGLLYGMSIEYQVKDGRETLICSSEEIRPIGFCPGKRPITRITVLETLVACADDIGQLFTFEVDPLRPHRMVTPKLAFPNLTIRCVLPMALLATHHLIETTNRDGIRIIDLETSKISTAFKQKNTADPGLATATAVSPSGDLVAVGSSTGVVEIFNIHTKDMIATLRLSDGAPLHQITFVTNSRLICAAYGGAVLVLSLRPDKHFKNMFQLSILRALKIGFEPAKLLLLGDTLLITVHRDSSIIVIKPAH